jgi:hypothetical protein
MGSLVHLETLGIICPLLFGGSAEMLKSLQSSGVQP